MNGFDYYEGNHRQLWIQDNLCWKMKSWTEEVAIFDSWEDVCDEDGIPFHKSWKGNKYFH